METNDLDQMDPMVVDVSMGDSDSTNYKEIVPSASTPIMPESSVAVQYSSLGSSMLLNVPDISRSINFNHGNISSGMETSYELRVDANIDTRWINYTHFECCYEKIR